MKVFKYLLFTIFVIWQSPLWAQSQKDCEPIDVAVEVVQLPDGKRTIKLVFKVESDYEISLLGAGKSKNRLEIKTKEIQDVEPGKYDLVITDNKRKNVCPKHVKVEVQ